MDLVTRLEHAEREGRELRATVNRLAAENRDLRAKLARAIVLPEPVPQPEFGRALGVEP
ncbi:MAG: hypothetical protein ACYCQK_02015 [Acidiferrobacteraceae bacterium]